MPRQPLTPQRKAWAAERGGHTFKGRPLNMPAASERRYQAELSAMVDQMTRIVARAVVRAFEEPAAVRADVALDAPSFTVLVARILARMSERFDLLFTRRAGGLAETLTKGVSASSAVQLGASLKEVSGGLTLKTDVISGRVAEVLQASTKQNVALIKSIPQEYFKDIEGAVMRSIQEGNGAQDLRSTIEKIGHSTKKRANLIAVDQTRKATTAVNRARMQGLGIRKFEWLHSAGGKEPRPLHVAYNGRVFDLDNPPVIDERTGERGLPGQLINCRCRMVPVVSFGDDDE